MSKTSLRKLQAGTLLAAFFLTTSVPPSLAQSIEASTTGNPVISLKPEASVIDSTALVNPSSHPGFIESTDALVRPESCVYDPSAFMNSESSIYDHSMNSSIYAARLDGELPPPLELEAAALTTLNGSYRAAQPADPGLVADDGVIVVDNDVVKKAESGIQEVEVWKQVQSEPGKTIITMGARFPVVVVSAHNSRSCKVGDRVEARLKANVLFEDKLIAGKNAVVLGHITSAHKARRLLIAEMMPKRWMRANGAIGLQFDEIITANGEHLALNAVPARMPRIIVNKAEGRIMGVNHKGELVAPLSTQLKHQGLHLAIRGAASAGGVFSMGAVPVIFGVIGAINPSFAFMHTVGKNVPHRRLKGFGMGVVSGLPGGFLVADYMIKGVESSIKPGDEFLVELKKDFNGEAVTAAELQPDANLKVQGEVMKQKPAKKKAKKLKKAS